MRRQLLGWTSALALAMGAHSALADTIPFSENFDAVSLGSTTGFTSQQSWVVVDGNVDTITNGFGGITCRNGSAGCVDMDGSSQAITGILLNSGTFNLLAGHTYQLSAWISGNQRGSLSSDPDSIAFGFASAAPLVPLVGGAAQTGFLAPDAAFALFTVLYTPVADITARVFFFDGLVSDSFGAILDDVSVTDITAVPLPASAWLLLTGLLALGVVSRRKVAMPFAA